MPRDPQRLPDPVHVVLDLARELNLQTVAHESPAMAFAIFEGTLLYDVPDAERAKQQCLRDAVRSLAFSFGVHEYGSTLGHVLLACYPAALLDAVCRECGTVHTGTQAIAAENTRLRNALSALGLDPDTLLVRNGGYATESEIGGFTLRGASTNTVSWCLCSPISREANVAGRCLFCGRQIAPVAR